LLYLYFKQRSLKKKDSKEKLILDIVNEKKGNDNNATQNNKKLKNSQQKKTETTDESKKIENKIVEIVSIKFHAFVAPEFKVDLKNHRFGIISDYDWKSIRPLNIR